MIVNIELKELNRLQRAERELKHRESKRDTYWRDYGFFEKIELLLLDVHLWKTRLCVVTRLQNR